MDIEEDKYHGTDHNNNNKNMQNILNSECCKEKKDEHSYKTIKTSFKSMFQGASC